MSTPDVATQDDPGRRNLPPSQDKPPDDAIDDLSINEHGGGPRGRRQAEGQTPAGHKEGEEKEQEAYDIARSEIKHLYLTFETPLPEPNTLNSSRNTGATPPFSPSPPPPPPPDLTPFMNPLQWPTHRKSLMLLLSNIATFVTAYTAGSYSPPTHVMASALGASHTAVAAGITTFCMGFALAPMVLAPLSEINGRYPVFVASGLVLLVSQCLCGAATSLEGMLAARFLTGVGGSVFSTMVGGIIADMWDAEGRNTPMALFSGSVLVGTGAGPLVGAVFTNERFAGGGGGGWRWVFWHQAIMAAVVVVALSVLLKESRGSVLLSRRARALNRWYEELEECGYYGVWIEEDEVLRCQQQQQQQHAAVAAFGSETESEQSESKTEADISGIAPPQSPRARRMMPFEDGDTAAVSDEEKKIASSSSRRNSSISGAALHRIRWKVKADEERASISKMISISVYRPFHLLITEPVVFWFSLWVAFAWAVLYLTFGCIPLVYTTVYGWSVEASGRMFVAMIVGSVIATALGIAQERLLHHPCWDAYSDVDPATLYGTRWAFLRRRLPTNVPESRLYFTCVSATLLPIGLFAFGLSARPELHWIGPAIAIALATMGIFVVYLATFNYLADVYHAYASSALAAQSCCRNVLGGVFPLVTSALFRDLGPANAGVLLGCIATALTFVPWVLVVYGQKIRARSHFAVAS